MGVFLHVNGYPEMYKSSKYMGIQVRNEWLKWRGLIVSGTRDVVVEKAV
jgi:hypothetical protein